MTRSLLASLAIAVVSVALAATAISGCFNKPLPDCAYLCGNDAPQCPDGYFCAGDGACKRNGLVDTFDCGFAGPADASVPVDAPADAPIDAAIDAAIDADVDAPI